MALLLHPVLHRVLIRAPFFLTFAAVLAPLVSNSTGNVLIAAAFLALLFAHFRFQHPLRFPPLHLPLTLFFLTTLVAVALSGHIRDGWPGIRKFYLYLLLLLVYSTFQKARELYALIVALTGVMAVSAIVSLFQFSRKVHQAAARQEDFYQYYTGERITGFMSHWMTLGGQEMMVLLMALALLLFAPRPRWLLALLAPCAIITLSLLLGYTRSMWLGAAAGAAFLLWLWNRKALLLAPLPLLLLLWLNPAGLGERLRSTVQPHGDRDSNAFRSVCRATAYRMIKAHPFFGLGPEQVKAQFMDYVPPDIPRPLPTGWYGHLHNVYLQYTAERGLFAGIAFLWFLAKIFLDFFPSPRHPILYGCLAVLIAVCLAGFYEHNLGDGEVLSLFLALTAAGYVARDLQQEDQTAHLLSTTSPAS